MLLAKNNSVSYCGSAYRILPIIDTDFQHNDDIEQRDPFCGRILTKFGEHTWELQAKSMDSEFRIKYGRICTFVHKKKVLSTKRQHKENW